MIPIIACASQTHKKDKPNQDFCIVFQNQKLNFQGVIVADGIGSHYRSELSSKFCVENLKERLERIESMPIDFNKLFHEVHTDLIQYANTALSPEEREKTVLGTTLICACEFDSEYQFAYLGNGSIWQISGNFNHFSTNTYLPWNSINLLNPHTVQENGVSSLYKYFSIVDINTNPSIIKISKNEDSYGDIIVIATDGIYTNDDAKIGKDDNGVIWQMVENSMIELYKAFNALFADNSSQLTTERLEQDLNKYLSFLKEKDIMADDTTLGVIISSKTINYQNDFWTKKSQIEPKQEQKEFESKETDKESISDKSKDEANTSSEVC